MRVFFKTAIACLALATATQASAGNGWLANATVGASAGYSWENYNDESSDYGWRASVHSGVDVARDWTAQAEIAYGRAGYGNGTLDTTAGFLVLKYRLPTVGGVRTYVHAGPGAGLFDFEGFDSSAWGGRGGIGFDVAVGQHTSIFTELNYERFFDVDTPTGDDDVSRTEIRVGVNQRFY